MDDTVTREQLQKALRERHTQEVQEKLDKARVAVAGLGGLGSHVAAALDDLAIIPYEDSESLPGAGGMALTRELIGSLKPGQSLSIFIGPEGGFSDGEVELAMQSGVKPVTLGKRILRTETAGMFVMAAVGLLLES